MWVWCKSETFVGIWAKLLVNRCCTCSLVVCMESFAKCNVCIIRVHMYRGSAVDNCYRTSAQRNKHYELLVELVIFFVMACSRRAVTNHTAGHFERRTVPDLLTTIIIVYHTGTREVSYSKLDTKAWWGYLLYCGKCVGRRPAWRVVYTIRMHGLGLWTRSYRAILQCLEVVRSECFPNMVLVNVYIMLTGWSRFVKQFEHWRLLASEKWRRVLSCKFTNVLPSSES
jgi:hypothetical protein